MMKWMIGIALAFSLAFVGACSKDKKDDKDSNTPTTSVTSTPSTSATNSEGPEIADDDLPIETDFEEAAQNEITADNYKQELDSLEKEIAAGQ